MKQLFILGVLSLSASAFSQTCYVDLVDTRNRPLTTFTGFDCQEAMKQCRKEVRFNQTGLSGVDCINRSMAPAPIPVPQPQRPTGPTGPIPQQPRYDVTVSGFIENQIFSFTARNASEIYVNCLSDIRNFMFGQVDDLFITTNNNRFKTFRNDSFYYNELNICTILEQEARSVDVVPAYTRPVRIAGSLERSGFQIEAFDRLSLLDNCVQTISGLNLGNTDEMSISLNGAPFTRLATSNWWYNPQQVCKVLIQNIDNQI